MLVHRCITAEGTELFTWGLNTSGVLGHGADHKEVWEPKKVDHASCLDLLGMHKKIKIHDSITRSSNLISNVLIFVFKFFFTSIFNFVCI